MKTPEEIIEQPDNLAPVRLCCGYRHYGPVCPDGLVTCSLCFHRFPIGELNFVNDRPEDVCIDCARKEANLLKERNKHE